MTHVHAARARNLGEPIAIACRQLIGELHVIAESMRRSPGADAKRERFALRHLRPQNHHRGERHPAHEDQHQAREQGIGKEAHFCVKSEG